MDSSVKNELASAIRITWIDPNNMLYINQNKIVDRCIDFYKHK